MKNNDSFKIFYQVETLLWETPIDPEKDINQQKKNNIHHSVKEFHDNDLFTARKMAFLYADETIKDLCLSAGEPYQDDFQARRVLQRYFRHQGSNPKDDLDVDDFLCGISVNLIVCNGNKRDVVNLYGLSFYDDDDKNEIVSDLLFYSMELVRERRYYGRLLQVQDESFEVFDFTPIGGIPRCLLNSPIDWNHFVQTFKPNDLFLCFNDRISFYERLCDPLIVGSPDIETIPNAHRDVVLYEDNYDKGLCEEWKRINKQQPK